MLLDWFEENQRVMPWRGETDPYRIWVSEIILQQTRVGQGWDYYLRFIERFPNVNSLAEAALEEVLHVWQGLGYYTRARNMHFAAQQIVKEHKGSFPHEYKNIRRLKGIGEYTAAAIGSIAFGLPYPAVDGNVLRVIARIFGIYEDIAQQNTLHTVSQLCRELMDNENPSGFNQALMELGAIQCTPKNPKCNTCPFATQCVACTKEHLQILPIKSSKIKIKERFLHYFIFNKNGKTMIEQRTANDIWKNLFQFPLIETMNTCENIDATGLLTAGFGKCNPLFFKEVKHKLTHQHLTIRFYKINNYLPDLKAHRITLSMKDLEKYPFPVPLNGILNISTSEIKSIVV